MTEARHPTLYGNQCGSIPRHHWDGSRILIGNTLASGHCEMTMTKAESLRANNSASMLASLRPYRDMEGVFAILQQMVA